MFPFNVTDKEAFQKIVAGNQYLLFRQLSRDVSASNGLSSQDACLVLKRELRYHRI